MTEAVGSIQSRQWIALWLKQDTGDCGVMCVGVGIFLGIFQGHRVVSCCTSPQTGNTAENSYTLLWKSEALNLSWPSDSDVYSSYRPSIQWHSTILRWGRLTGGGAIKMYESLYKSLNYANLVIANKLWIPILFLWASHLEKNPVLSLSGSQRSTCKSSLETSVTKQDGPILWRNMRGGTCPYLPRPRNRHNTQHNNTSLRPSCLWVIF